MFYFKCQKLSLCSLKWDAHLHLLKALIANKKEMPRTIDVLREHTGKHAHSNYECTTGFNFEWIFSHFFLSLLDSGAHNECYGANWRILYYWAVLSCKLYFEYRGYYGLMLIMLRVNKRFLIVHSLLSPLNPVYTSINRFYLRFSKFTLKCLHTNKDTFHNFP